MTITHSLLGRWSSLVEVKRRTASPCAGQVRTAVSVKCRVTIGLGKGKEWNLGTLLTPTTPSFAVPHGKIIIASLQCVRFLPTKLLYLMYYDVQVRTRSATLTSKTARNISDDIGAVFAALR